MQESRARALVLMLDYAHHVSYYDDWVDAFTTSNHFSCVVENLIGLQLSTLAREIEGYDCVIMLHSCNADTLEFLEPVVPVLAARRRARLLSFVGNEYNSPYLSTALRNKLLRQARVDIVVTQLLEEAGVYLYATTGAQVISVPHALNPTAFSPPGDTHQRTIDIGVKGYRYPPWLGDEERNRFIEHLQANADRLGLAVDLSFNSRVGREEWAQFLSSCRGTISSEVGSWHIAPDDDMIKEVYAYLRTKRRGLVIENEGTIRRLGRHLPMWVKTAVWKLLRMGLVRFEVVEDQNVSFAELNERFYHNAPRPPVYGKAISSRHFDAIGTKTCQIMLHGRFNDILNANEHYIAVEPDYSDFDDSIRRFKDAAERTEIADRAYHHVMAHHTYAHRAAAIYDALQR